MLIFEILSGDNCILATGKDDIGVCRLNYRVKSSERISHCREALEIYNICGDEDDWKVGRADFEVAKIADDDKTYLSTSLPFPTLKKHIMDNVVKSGGCYFRSPTLSESADSEYKSLSAGEIIDRCGLKGMSIGKAAVSEIHGNFLINTAEKGSSHDVLKLAEIVKKTVYARTGILLCEEVVFVKNPGKRV